MDLCLLSGVRFRRVGTHLNLEIMVTPLNFTAGTLDKPHQKSVWHGNDNTDASLEAPRYMLPLNEFFVTAKTFLSPTINCIHPSAGVTLH
jgi:hypothetical protein